MAGETYGGHFGVSFALADSGEPEGSVRLTLIQLMPVLAVRPLSTPCFSWFGWGSHPCLSKRKRVQSVLLGLGLIYLLVCLFIDVFSTLTFGQAGDRSEMIL